MKRLKETLLLLILSAINFAHILDFVIVMPLGPQLMRIFDINAQQFGLIVSSYTISAGICGLLGIFFIDRFDRKKALLTVFAGFSVGTLLCAAAPDYGFLLAARIVTGLFGGLINALIYSIVGDYIPYERRGAAMGKVMAAFAIASVMGVPIGLWLAEGFSWHMPFLALGVFSAAVWVVALFGLPVMRSHLLSLADRPRPTESFRSIVRDPNQIRALSLMMCMMLASFTVIPYISPYFVMNVGLQERDIMYLYLIGGGCTFISSQVIGRLSDRFGKRQMLIAICLLSIIPILLVTHIGVTPLPLALAASTLFFILVSGRQVPGIALITSTVPPQNRGGFMSFNAAVQQFSAGAASFIAGLILVTGSDDKIYHYGWVGLVATAFSLFTIPLARSIRPLEKKEAPGGEQPGGTEKAGTVEESVS